MTDKGLLATDLNQVCTVHTRVSVRSEHTGLKPRGTEGAPPPSALHRLGRPSAAVKTSRPFRYEVAARPLGGDARRSSSRPLPAVATPRSLDRSISRSLDGCTRRVSPCHHHAVASCCHHDVSSCCHHDAQSLFSKRPSGAATGASATEACVLEVTLMLLPPHHDRSGGFTTTSNRHIMIVLEVYQATGLRKADWIGKNDVR